jgi:hypothetical protein
LTEASGENQRNRNQPIHRADLFNFGDESKIGLGWDYATISMQKYQKIRIKTTKNGV